MELREKIINELDISLLPYITKEVIKVADNIMELLPQWISVSERLPEEEGLYLVKWPNGIDPIEFKEAIKVLSHFSSLSWLGPLPKPPKEGE